MSSGQRGEEAGKVAASLAIAKQDAKFNSEVGEITKEMWDKLLIDFPHYPSPMINIMSTPTRSSNFFYDEYCKGVWNEDKETETNRSGE